MEFINNIKSAFTQKVALPTIKYGDSEEWFLSDAGKNALNKSKTTVELTDFTFHYLQSIMANKKLLNNEDLYSLAFILSDSMINSNQVYAGKENLLNESVHPFIAYFKKLKRSLSTKTLCYELLFILFGVVDPFDSTAWIYDSARSGYSEEEYQKIAENNNIDFKELLQQDYSGKEDIRLIMCEIIWLIGKSEFLKIIE